MQFEYKLETAQVSRTVEFTHRAKYLRHSNRFPLKVLNIQREKVPLFGPVSSLNNSIYSHNSKPKWSFFSRKNNYDTVCINILSPLCIS